MTQEGSQPSHLTVELAVGGRVIDKAMVMIDGRFQFRGVAEGLHEIRVTGPYGDVLRRDHVSVGKYTSPVVLTLPRSGISTPVSGAISIGRLATPVPGKARREFAGAQKALAKGDVDESIRRLAKAIEIHPGYVEAHNNLGVRYMLRGELERAASEFQEAAGLDPGAALPQANLALV
ncbi:MAG: tetratricopeptide repeat protein, partial [Bryobacteraceae bacterium]